MLVPCRISDPRPDEWSVELASLPHAGDVIVRGAIHYVVARRVWQDGVATVVVDRVSRPGAPGAAEASLFARDPEGQTDP